MKVRILDTLGCDKTIYKAATMSTEKFNKDITDYDLEVFLFKLLYNEHMVPFEHCVISYDIKAPIFVFRQLFRYRTAAISERSLRYCEALPEFYMDHDLNDEQLKKMYDACQFSMKTYNELKDMGCSKEVARSVLPLSIYSGCVFTMNLRNLIHLWDQRIDKHAQKEIQQVAKEMKEKAREFFPIAIEVYDNLRGKNV